MTDQYARLAERPNIDPFAHLVDIDVIDIDALAADLAHLRVIGVRLAELAQAPLFAHGVRVEALALAELVEQLATVTFRRIFDEDLPDLERPRVWRCRCGRDVPIGKRCPGRAMDVAHVPADA